MDVDPNLKISELERKLSEEKDRCDHLNSQSDLAKLAAIREVEIQKRGCLMLRETVARLEEDCKILREREIRDREIMARLEQDNKTLREREIKDRETVKGLLEEIQQKDRNFQEKLVDIELEKKKAEDKVLGWKNKHSRVSKLFDDTVAEFGRKKREFVKLAEQYTYSEARSLKTSKENSTLKTKYNVEENFHLSKHAKEIDEDLPKSSVLEMAKSGRVMVDSDSEDYEEDRIPISQLINERVAEVCEGDRKDSHSSSKCFVTPKPRKVGIHGAEGTRLDEVADRANQTLQVADRANQTYTNRNLSHSNWLCAGRTPSSEQCKQAEKRAQIFQRNLRPCNPSFIKTLGRSHVSSGFWFHIPINFCKENLPSQDQKMILEDERGLEFKVNYMSRRTAFSGGWMHFALTHKLELGDTLIFELLEPARLKVYVIKAIPEDSGKDFDQKNLDGNTAGPVEWKDGNSTENEDVDLLDAQQIFKSWK